MGSERRSWDVIHVTLIGMGWMPHYSAPLSVPAFHMLLQSITEDSTDFTLSRQGEGAGAFVPGRISALRSSVESWVANTKENPEKKGNILRLRPRKRLEQRACGKGDGGEEDQRTWSSGWGWAVMCCSPPCPVLPSPPGGSSRLCTQRGCVPAGASWSRVKPAPAPACEYSRAHSSPGTAVLLHGPLHPFLSFL